MRFSSLPLPLCLSISLALLLVGSFPAPSFAIETENVRAPIGSTYKTHDPDQLSLLSINEHHHFLTQTGLYTLGAWAVVNVGAGFALSSGKSGETYHFWRLNAYWNMVNLGIAGVGLYLHQRQAKKTHNLWESLEEHRSALNAYLFNAGLDLGYILAGAAVISRGNASSGADRDKWRGYGRAIIFQGAFLLGLDVVMYLAVKNNSDKMSEILKNVVVSQNSLGYRIHF